MTMLPIGRSTPGVVVEAHLRVSMNQSAGIPSPGEVIYSFSLSFFFLSLSLFLPSSFTTKDTAAKPPRRAEESRN